MTALPRARRIGRTDGAVSDVVGSILLVGITISLAAVMAVLVFSFRGPSDFPQTNVEVTVSPGNGAWGNGDEQVVVRHLGGEALDEGSTTVAYRINNGAPVTITGAALNFPNDRLETGDAWTVTLTLQGTDSVSINLISRQSGDGATVALATVTLIPAQVSSSAACPLDVAPPTASWQQAPADLTIGSSGAVTLTLTLTDDCAGVDTGVASTPHIWWALSPTAPSDQGLMTYVSGTTWTATIPQPMGGWSQAALKTLSYYATPVKDLSGNSGQTTPTRTDVVDVSGTLTYPSATSVVSPTTFTTPANLNADDAANAVVNEGLPGAPCTPGTTSSNANAVVSSGTGWSGTGNAFTSDNSRATNSNSAPGVLRLGFPNPSAGCTISVVRLKIEQQITSFSNDRWTIQACFAGGACGTAAASQAGTASDSVLTFDMTSLRPGGGSWTWTDINNLEIAIQPTLQSGRDGTWGVDLASFEVVSLGYTATAQVDITGIPAGTQFLDLEYVGSSDESFFLNVWQWTGGSANTYVTRGTLDQTSLTRFTYALTADEVQSGNVRLRFVDANNLDIVASTLSLDYVRVVTA